jgi:hypothetical protein
MYKYFIALMFCVAIARFGSHILVWSGVIH